jgi:hypothetical protein
MGSQAEKILFPVVGPEVGRGGNRGLQNMDVTDSSKPAMKAQGLIMKRVDQVAIEPLGLRNRPAASAHRHGPDTDAQPQQGLRPCLSTAAPDRSPGKVSSLVAQGQQSHGIARLAGCCGLSSPFLHSDGSRQRRSSKPEKTRPKPASCVQAGAGLIQSPIRGGSAAAACHTRRGQTGSRRSSAPATAARAYCYMASVSASLRPDSWAWPRSTSMP